MGHDLRRCVIPQVSELITCHAAFILASGRLPLPRSVPREIVAAMPGDGRGYPWNRVSPEELDLVELDGYPPRRLSTRTIGMGCLVSGPPFWPGCPVAIRPDLRF